MAAKAKVEICLFEGCLTKGLWQERRSLPWYYILKQATFIYWPGHLTLGVVTSRFRFPSLAAMPVCSTFYGTSKAFSAWLLFLCFFFQWPTELCTGLKS